MPEDLDQRRVAAKHALDGIELRGIERDARRAAPIGVRCRRRTLRVRASPVCSSFSSALSSMLGSARSSPLTAAPPRLCAAAKMAAATSSREIAASGRLQRGARVAGEMMALRSAVGPL